ncbi:MAG: CCA tRNA nucleotidyltransferase [Pseudolabrys sp.]|nr:CCA tRNA nucleotidyltransferase [Pseudolabrys sp.]
MTSQATSVAGADWLSNGALARLLAVLDRDGEEARVVGGAVRNALLKMSIAEIDVATTAVPQDVVSRVEKAGFKAVPTGIEHGTVTVVIDGAPFEVTTLRRDVETYGRHAKVAFGRDWKGDAERRDFTINALSATRDGTVHDYVGGLVDLAQRKVRFIGEAKTRIEEDYLRILRFFRFHAAYGKGELDHMGLHACIEARDGLEQLSRERVRMEFMKLLVAPGAAAVLQSMADGGFLTFVLHSVPNVVHFSAMAAIENALALPADAIRRLAALVVMVTEDAERLSGQLRLSNAERMRLLSMAQVWWRRIVPVGDRLARPWLYRLGTSHFTDRVLLAWARWNVPPDDPQWRELASLPQRWSIPQFPLKAADLMQRGVAKGPALGAALAVAEEAWIAADFPSDQASLDKIADAASNT